MDKLMESYVIMICSFDLFGEGRHVYTFKNLCKEDPELELGDGTCKLVLNAVGTMNDVSAKLKAFLDYVAGKAVDDEYVKKLDEAVKRARINKKWRTEYMIINMRDREHEYIGREMHKREQIAEMLKDGKTPEEISAFCKYPMELIEEVQKNMIAETVK